MEEETCMAGFNRNQVIVWLYVKMGGTNNVSGTNNERWDREKALGKDGCNSTHLADICPPIAGVN